MIQQRRDEILAKKAKLAELKRQRELRSRVASSSKQLLGSSSDVCYYPIHGRLRLTGDSLQQLIQTEWRIAKNWTSTYPPY